ncbi:hypothetical protein AYI68_g2279 [Smittium mucronatum]|uniref:Uncharacterized protein n=1 Tax=Smittium mucronatum TaxID=133383 RepID=A0A1R0H365_9FUNG|nr:hypothetical protein AYI68_g2279 [Smittium mucronatum]
MFALLKIEDFKKLEILQQDSLSWVVGTSNKNGRKYHRLIKSLTGIEPIKDRFKTLLIKFDINLSKVDDQNPLKLLILFYENSTHFKPNKSLIGKGIHKYIFIIEKYQL